MINYFGISYEQTWLGVPIWQLPDDLVTLHRTIATDPGPVMVFLDDWHDGDHVYAEMQMYSRVVTPEGILIVRDTTFENLADTSVGVPSENYPDVKR